MWQRGQQLEKKKESSFKNNNNDRRNKKNNYDNRRQDNNKPDNNRPDNNRQYNYNKQDNYKRQNNYRRNDYNKQELEQLERIKQENRIIVPINENVKNEKVDHFYLDKCRQKKEEDEKNNTKINTKRSEYWRGNIWIGPILIKQEKAKTTKWKNYMEAVKKNPPSSILMPCNALYSRDNENWYKSYKETFTHEEWELMESQKLMENAEQLSRRMEEKYNRDLKEAYEEYYETGNMNSMVQVDMEDKAYDKYLEEMEKEEEEYIIESSDEEYVESDNYDSN